MQTLQTKVMLAIMVLGAIVTMASAALPWVTLNVRVGTESMDHTLSGIGMMTDTQGLEVSFAPAVFIVIGIAVVVLAVYSYMKEADMSATSTLFTLLVIAMMIIAQSAGGSPMYVDSASFPLTGITGIVEGIPDWVTAMFGPDVSSFYASSEYGKWIGVVGMFVSWLAAINAYRVRRSAM